MESKFFKIFLDTTVGQINNRVDLQGEPLDRGRVEAALEQFLTQEL
jgi:hypothetical protein